MFYVFTLSIYIKRLYRFMGLLVQRKHRIGRSGCRRNMFYLFKGAVFVYFDKNYFLIKAKRLIGLKISENDFRSS